MWAIEQSDVVEWATRYQGEPYHSMLCDPPYHLGKQGFMGHKWDASGVAFNPETWAALATHLHPGAFGMAFASSRGWHRLAVAIEDAGLIIQWLREQPIRPFVILDDDRDMGYLISFLIRTSYDTGLTMKHAREALSHLRSQANRLKRIMKK